MSDMIEEVKEIESQKDLKERHNLKTQDIIEEIIKNPNSELDIPKVWEIKSYFLEDGQRFDPIHGEKNKVIMTERQKRLIVKTYGLETLKAFGTQCIYEIEEIPEKEFTDEEKAEIEDMKKEIELIKSSTDPKLDKKGRYIAKVSKEDYANFFYLERVDIEITSRQALLATTEKTRDYFKPYTKREEFSKITLKSIKEAINNRFKSR